MNIQGDINPEGDDGFTVTLSNPSAGATILDGSATGTIVNDDGPPPLVTINDVTVTEGNSGSSLMTFTVTRSGGTGAFDVDFRLPTAAQPPARIHDYQRHSVFRERPADRDAQRSNPRDTDPELSETLQVTSPTPPISR